MDKRTIAAEIQKMNGGAPFISVNRLAKILRISKHSDTKNGGLPRLLEGLTYLERGNSRQYLVIDIAAKLMEQRKRG